MTPGNRAAGRLFMRAAQAGRAAEAHVDRFTAPLFPLPLILEAEGTLAADARHLARGTDPETSKQAAARAKSFVAGHEATCLAVIREAGERGATARDIERITAGTPRALTFIQANRRLGKMGERSLITRRLKPRTTKDNDWQARGRSAIWWAA